MYKQIHKYIYVYMTIIIEKEEAINLGGGMGGV